MSSAIATVLGRVSDDPAITTSRNGNKIARFRMGWSKKVEGETKWSNISVTFFGKQVDTIEQYVSKGSTVMVTGNLEENTWDNKDGVKQYSMQLIGLTFSLEGKPTDKSDSNEKPQGAKQQAKKPAPAAAKSSGSDGDFPDDDGFGNIPF